MHGFIIDTIAHGGYIGILLLMALENIIPPIPSELVMGLGGVLVAQGHMHFWPLLVFGTIGSTAGIYFWFWISDRFGYKRLKPAVNRWGRWLTLEWRDIERAKLFLRRHGQWVVLAARCSPCFRTIISVPAGLVHMKLWRFLVFTLAGTALWNLLLIAGGKWLAGAFNESLVVIDWMVVVMAAGGVAYYLWRLATWRPRRRRQPA
jgi:membrane protein DedA with SNARE-associated domain